MAPCTTVQAVDIFFRIIDFCNILRGFFFFIIFVCKRSIWEKVRHYWFLKFSSSPQDQYGLELKSFGAEDFHRRANPFDTQETFTPMIHNQDRPETGHCWNMIHAWFILEWIVLLLKYGSKRQEGPLHSN